MIKIIDCDIRDNGSDFSLPSGTSLKCMDCGHEEKTNSRLSGSISCPKCGSKKVDVNGDEK